MQWFSQGKTLGGAHELTDVYRSIRNLMLRAVFTGTIVDSATLSEFAKLGTYCQFDLFGIENSYYQVRVLCINSYKNTSY